MSINRDTLLRGYFYLATVVVNTLLLLALVEGVTRGLPLLKHVNKEARDARAALSYYQNVSWGEVYWREYALSSRERYEPFVVWRRQSFTGRLINVDTAGLRIAPNLQCADTSIHVAVFGGSTVWGTGAPDELTIPAQLQTILNAESREESFCVTNFGESGYVTTQEVITLLQALRRQRRIDIAVFYDGINDVYAAFQSGRTDVHQNVAQVAARFDVAAKRPLAHRIEDFLYENSAAYRGVRNAFHKLDRNPPVLPFTAEDSEMVERAITNYVFNVGLVKQLSEHYAFEVFFFWQPVLFTSHKPLTEDELPMLSQLDRRAAQFYKKAAESIAAHSDTTVVNLTGIFDDRTEMTWIDWAHITPEAGGIVAQEIAKRIRR